MKKSVIVLSSFVIVILLSFAFTRPDDPKYTNLKVLPKNITKNQMDSVMKHYSAALGVKCGFCHTYDQKAEAMNFASDENKHKNIARDMIRLTNRINKKFFNVKNSKSLDSQLEVTCHTCHNGREHPARFAPPQAKK